MLGLLRAHDAELAELHCGSGSGSVLVCPCLQGRIFCQLDGELVHRLDAEALATPSATDFNNRGGNSLWPAPEGGPFAFNYLPGSDRWRVQKGIGETAAELVRHDTNNVLIEKRIDLTNRRGVRIKVIYRRAVSVPTGTRNWNPVTPGGYELTGLRYRTEDTFEPLGLYRIEDVLLAPWSLEQFPGVEGVTVFCKVREPETAINFDFYARPEGRIAYGRGFFTFVLGGEARHQIGVRAASAAEFIGALDSNRSILMLRRTTPHDGVYFNIADNDQPGGPFSAADLYSVFNGGALRFFELETIGAMQVKDGCLAKSTLESETTVLKGNKTELRRYLAEQHGLRLEEHLA